MSSPARPFSLMVHGGAGALDNLSPAKAAAYRDALHQVLETGRELFAAGATALDVAITCAALLEDEPLFNAGRGSVLNEDGRVEMDAALMDGRDLAAGAVAGVSNIANPIRLAHKVMTETTHVMLIGDGAMRFAGLQGLETVPDDYFLTPERRRQFEQARRSGRALLEHDETANTAPDEKMGTIGCVAFDTHGHLAAATSTGGISNKRFGRVGDSPIIGAGCYADDETCAVSATGYGEDFMRTVLAKHLADSIAFLDLDAATAVGRAMETLHRRVAGRGGVICIDREGRCANGFTTKRMIRGWIEHGGETLTAIDR